MSADGREDDAVTPSLYGAIGRWTVGISSAILVAGVSALVGVLWVMNAEMATVTERLNEQDKHFESTDRAVVCLQELQRRGHATESPGP